MKIDELIIELLSRGIPINGSELVEHSLNGKSTIALGYRVPGFSKSGTVTLFDVDGEILAKERYDSYTKIGSFDDLASLAWKWFINYKDRSPFEEPDRIWKPYFIEKGWIEVKEVISYDYIIKK